jgi:hypothetical protein
LGTAAVQRYFKVTDECAQATRIKAAANRKRGQL